MGSPGQPRGDVKPAQRSAVAYRHAPNTLKSQFPEGWQAHANDLLRFFMDTSQAKEREFEHVAQQARENGSKTAGFERMGHATIKRWLKLRHTKLPWVQPSRL